MRTVLLTGGAGFIGGHIAEKLLHENYKVIILDNLVTGSETNIPKEAIFIKGDVKNMADIDTVFAQHSIDIIFHLAGQPSIVNAFSDPFTDVNTNFIGSINMILAAVHHKVQRFLYASSMTLYGNAKEIPITEETSPNPINYYGIAKYAAERFIHATANRVDLETPLNVTSLRMFNVYGPGQSLTNPYQGVLAIFIGNVLRNEPITIYGDGKQTRDFVYVKDVAETWVKSIDNPTSFGNVYNIGSGEKITITQLAQTVVKACGHDVEKYPIMYKDKRSGDQRDVQADISLARKDLSFEPFYSLEKGLTETLTWAKTLK